MKDCLFSITLRRVFLATKGGLFIFFLLLVYPLRATETSLPLAAHEQQEAHHTPEKEFYLLVSGGLHQHIYAAYGHVALRMMDTQEGIDIVYNWGIFDFDAPNFIGKFIEGNTTDYMLGVQDTRSFIEQYVTQGSPVYETKLSLTSEEKEKLFELLEKNLKDPYYLYNFVFDNCSTRPFELLALTVDGEMEYPEVPLTTRRKMVDQYAQGRPWLEFGTDVVLGKPADEEIGAKDQLFLPLYANEIVKGIKIVSPSGEKRNLAISQHEYPALIEQEPIPETSFFFLPFFVTLVLFLITEYTSFYPRRNLRWFRIWSTLFLSAMGLAGCLVFYLSCFSLHPLVRPNFNMMVYHPFYLLISIPTIWRKETLFGHIYHLLNLLTQIVFVLFIAWFSSQVFSPATLFLSLASMAISLRYSGTFILSKLRKLHNRSNHHHTKKKKNTSLDRD